MSIEVLKPGLQTTLQDGGRAGYARIGVGSAGAFDAPALRLANALVGNPRSACALEITVLGPTLLFHRDAWIALTGAPVAPHVDDDELTMWTPCFVRAGATLSFSTMRRGCRAYLAVRGGFDVETMLGSRSTDINAGLGPLHGRALRTGDRLPVGEAAPLQMSVCKWSIDSRHWFDENCDHPLRLISATHTRMLDASSRAALFEQTFRIGADSNRAGLRLTGVPLALSESIELVSEGCVAGTVQLPPSGQPIALGVEHPVSGGYPRIGQIAAADLPRLAQRRPGNALRFAPCNIEEALRARIEQENTLRETESVIARRLLSCQ